MLTLNYIGIAVWEVQSTEGFKSFPWELECCVKGVTHQVRGIAPSLKFKHIVFYECTHTEGTTQHLSIAPSYISGGYSKRMLLK